MGRREGAKKNGKRQSVCQIKEVIVECIYWEENKMKKEAMKASEDMSREKRAC